MGSRTIFATLLGVFFLGACDHSADQDQTPTHAQSAEPDGAGEPSADGPAARHTYTVRGRVVDLPSPDRPASDFVLEHEEIPDFVRSDGSLGMPAMRMPFSSEEPIDLSRLKIGDKVELEWIVWWDGSYPHSIIRNIRVLDPAAPLALPGGDG